MGERTKNVAKGIRDDLKEVLRRNGALELAIASLAVAVQRKNDPTMVAANREAVLIARELCDMYLASAKFSDELSLQASPAP